MWIPCLLRSTRASGEVSVQVGHELATTTCGSCPDGPDATPSSPRATTANLRENSGFEAVSDLVPATDERVEEGGRRLGAE